MNPILTPEAANKAIEDFAIARGLLTYIGGGRRSLVWLDGSLAGDVLTWHESGALDPEGITFCVTPPNGDRLNTVGHSAPVAAYDAALAQAHKQRYTTTPSATSGGHLDADGHPPLGVEIRDAENKLRDFAIARGLDTGDDDYNRLFVSLGGPLRGCDLTCGHNAGESLTFRVVTQQGKHVAHGHATPEGAYDAALAQASTPKPITRREIHREDRTAANKAMTSFAIKHRFYEYAQPESGGGRNIVRPKPPRDHLEIAWEWDGKDATYFARDRNGGSILASHCATPEEAFDKAREYMDAVESKRVKATTPTPPQPTARLRIYVCHPYSADPAGNAAKVAAICKRLIGEFLLPIAPQIYLGAFINDSKDRELAMDVCLDLLAGCDEVRVYGPTLSPGMLEELRFAMARGMVITHHSTD